MGKQEDVEWYKEKIVEMADGIEDVEFLENIYWFAKTTLRKYTKQKEED